jgi:hypothetical protein
VSIRAKVQNGRLIVDEPTLLAEGMVLDLVIDDEGDDLPDEERAVLHAHLEASARSAAAGRVRPVGKLLAELRELRGR